MSGESSATGGLVLRDYQEASLSALREGFAGGHRVQMLYAPTGSGKTESAISLMQATAEKGNRVAMVLDRRVLCDQTSGRLEKYGIDHGVLMAGHWRYRPDRHVQVCSAQTLEARGSFPDLRLLIVDEAHTTRQSTIDFIKNNPRVRVVGLSASPFTKGLGDIYTNVINATTTRALVDTGQLSSLRVFIATPIDMAGAKKVGGEWSAAEATERGIKITGDVVTEWTKKTHEIFGEPRKTIVFSAGVAHGKDLAQGFNAAGHNFISISYKDDDDFKAEVLADFSRADTKITGIIATDILTKGVDQADVCIGISARPFTKSFSSHVQQLGRVMRPHPAKEYSIWLDHSGNYLRFLDQWDELYESGVSALHEGGDEKPKPEPTDKEKEAAKCPKCGGFWPRNADSCPYCGHVHVKRNAVVAVAGVLTELNPSAKKKAPESSESSEYKMAWYQGMVALLRQRGKNDGQAYYLYRAKFGVAPPWKKKSGVITLDVMNYLQQANIAYAKSQKAKGGESPQTMSGGNRV
ncbi:MAG: putative DNA repair helicase RadD [Firmicutes bacterium]|nr:putative DNA repair helicase RadD [Bacillota bacterium]